MDSLTKKTLKTSRGFNYTYYVSPAASGKPTLLLLHGFPDHAEMWVDLATKHLVPAGYGVVIPDCLGYDGTDKPTNPKEYVFDGQSQDMCDILDAEKIDKVIPVGHDWGSLFSQRMYIWHPERCIGLVNLNVAYRGREEGDFSLEQLDEALSGMFGYFPFACWYFFSSPEGPKIIEDNLNSFYDLIHPADPKEWLNTMCAKPHKAQQWTEEGRRGDVQDYAKAPGARESFVARLKRDGLTAPLCWYRAMTEGHQGQAESKLSADRFKVEVPYMFIAGLQDAICLPAAIEMPKAEGLLPKLTYKEVDGPHWGMLAKPEEMGKHFLSWLGENY